MSADLNKGSKAADLGASGFVRARADAEFI
jgi:hypothetical protein